MGSIVALHLRGLRPKFGRIRRRSEGFFAGFGQIPELDFLRRDTGVLFSVFSSMSLLPLLARYHELIMTGFAANCDIPPVCLEAATRLAEGPAGG